MVNFIIQKLKSKHLVNLSFLSNIYLVFHYTINLPCTYPDHGRVCHKHFKEEDFVPASQNKTKEGKQRNTRTLKPSAVPSIYLLGEALDESSVSQYEKETNFDDDSNGSRVFEPKLEYLQENYYGSNFSTNPWDVSDPSVFLRYCCPECDFQAVELLGFSQHAVMNHILSETLFIDRNSSLIDYDGLENEKNPNVNSNAAKMKIKSENLESYEMDDLDTIDPFDNDETMESETNIGISGKKKKSRKRKKTNMKSNEGKLESEEATNDPPINIKSEIFESDMDNFVENVETLEPETNIEVKSKPIQFKERETEKGPFICEACGFIADTRKLLLRHRQITLACRTHINSFKCSYCEQKYSMKTKLECHIEAKHPGTSKLEYFCSICGDGFMFQKNMERHQRKHNKPDESVLEEKKTKKCSICGKRYFKNTNLLKHVEKAHEIPRASLHRHIETVSEADINEMLSKGQLISKCPFCIF